MKVKLTKDEAKLQTDRVLSVLKEKGYFTCRLISFKQDKSNFISKINLGMKTENLIIRFSKEVANLIDKEKLKDTIKIENTNLYKKSVTNLLLKKGVPFSDVSFKNYLFNGNSLLVDLIINKSKERKIQKVIFKGYENFPESFKKHYLKTQIQSTFNTSLLEDYENKLNDLNFVKVTKTPEVLFKKDSTIVYLHLKKTTNNSIDALININTNDNDGVQLNGILDLSLNNIFNHGEELNIYWNRVGFERSEIKVQTTVPYLLGSKIRSDIGFNIYRQDRSFLNTEAKLLIRYPLKDRTTIGIKVLTKSSNQIDENINPNISDFSSFYFGPFMNLTSAKKALNNKPILDQFYSLSFGNRKNNNQQESQFQLESIISSHIKINNRSLLFLKNITEMLFSKKYLENEIFRIGGINSIRGFNEQSVFTSKHSTLISEFRY